MTLFAEVVLSLPLDRGFVYTIPDAFKQKAVKGSRVLVPFKDRLLTGVIIKRIRAAPPNVSLKSIQSVLDDAPMFSPQFLSFTCQLSRYYYSSWGELLHVGLPASFSPQSKTRASITEKGCLALNGETLTPLERNVLTVLRHKSYSDIYLKRRIKSGHFSSLLSRLEKKGMIQVEKGLKSAAERKEKPVSSIPKQLEMDFSLDRESHRAAEVLVEKIGRDAFIPFYLFGSAEKREAVYFYLIKKAVSLGKKVLFLVPEIGLTGNLLEKFQTRLGENVALLHSQMSEGKREDEWLRIKAGRAAVVVGPRSALFSPVEDLGMIIVDEEQDDSYFQRESPSYDARRGAYLRAKQENAVLVYGSLAPNVEAFYEARKRKNLVILRRETPESRIEIIDDRLEHRIVSQKLKARIKESLAKKDPLLIFTNRRGYAAYVMCSRCRYIPRCEACDIAMTYHKRDDKLVCHYCDYTSGRPKECPECGGKIVRRREIGIEAVEEEVKRYFPEARVICYDADVVKKKKDRMGILSQFKDGQIDILIGTQLLAYERELPRVSLVAVLFPETILTLSDYNAGQRTYQMIHRMMRFLCSGSESTLIIQTSFPEHFSIRSSASGDFEAFFKEEIKFRRLMNYPPFTYLVEVLFLGENLRTLARKTREFSAFVTERAGEIEILGPALTAVSRLRGSNRIQIILKAKKKKDLDDVLPHALRRIKARKSVVVHY